MESKFEKLVMENKSDYEMGMALDRNLQHLMELLAAYGVTATVFVAVAAVSMLLRFW